MSLSRKTSRTLYISQRYKKSTAGATASTQPRRRYMQILAALSEWNAFILGVCCPWKVSVRPVVTVFHLIYCKPVCCRLNKRQTLYTDSVNCVDMRVVKSIFALKRLTCNNSNCHFMALSRTSSTIASVTRPVLQAVGNLNPCYQHCAFSTSVLLGCSREIIIL